MTRTEKNSPSPSLWLPLLLLACGLALRVVKLRSGSAEWAANLAPWMALAFTGAIVFPRALKWWVWPVALLAVDFAAQGMEAVGHLQHIWLVYLCFALAAFSGNSLRSRVTVLGTLGGVLACSLGFYVITNTQSWLMSPEYAKSFTGWAQALTTGLPGYPPTLFFLRNSLLSDIGFSVLLILAYNTEAVLRSFSRIPWTRRVNVPA